MRQVGRATGGRHSGAASGELVLAAIVHHAGSCNLPLITNCQNASALSETTGSDALCCHQMKLKLPTKEEQSSKLDNESIVNGGSPKKPLSAISKLKSRFSLHKYKKAKTNDRIRAFSQTSSPCNTRDNTSEMSQDDINDAAGKLDREIAIETDQICAKNRFDHAIPLNEMREENGFYDEVNASTGTTRIMIDDGCEMGDSNSFESITLENMDSRGDTTSDKDSCSAKSKVAPANRSQNGAALVDPVIEFKLDLIVDEPSETKSLTQDAVHSSAAIQDPSYLQIHHTDRHQVFCSEHSGSQQSIEYLKMRRKLEDNVNELVESFVLDSSDVCFMSVGCQLSHSHSLKHSTNSTTRYHESKNDSNSNQLEGNMRHDDDNCIQNAGHGREHEISAYDFSYMRKITSDTLAYSFNLLKSTHENKDLQATIQVTQQDTQSDETSHGENRTPVLDRRDFPRYSIELAAAFFLKGPSRKIEAHQGQFGHNKPEMASLSTIDLLTGLHQDATKDDAENQDACDAPQLEAVDCVTLEQALGVIANFGTMIANLDAGHLALSTQRSLLITAKLKREINGASFSNRMCLIDFSPDFADLKTIFNSIFSGQALSHLKMRRNQVEKIRKKLPEANPHTNGSRREETWNINCNIDYLVKLLRAETLLYKQLSSALIRTLITVHVHKVLRPSSGRELLPVRGLAPTKSSNNLGLACQRQVMADNLMRLQFAHDIRRACYMRMRRRKRHLRSHLASSQLSVSSEGIITDIDEDLMATSISQLYSPVHLNKSCQGMSSRNSPQSTSRPHKVTSRFFSGSLRDDVSSGRSRGPGDVIQHELNQATIRPSAAGVNQRLPGLSSKSVVSSANSAMHTFLYEKTSRTPSTLYHLRKYTNQNRHLNALNIGQSEDNRSSLSFDMHLDDSSSVRSASLNTHSSMMENLKDDRASPVTKRKHSDPKLQISGKCNLPKRSVPNKDRPYLASKTSTLLGYVRRDNSLKRRQKLSLGKRASSVIEIDCQPSKALQHASIDTLRDVSVMNEGQLVHPERQSNDDSQDRLDRMHMKFCHSENDGYVSDVGDNNADNVSDICSVSMAEPPKELKLEKFLGQLSSYIRPKDGNETKHSFDKKFNGHSETLILPQSNMLCIENHNEIDLNQNFTNTMNYLKIPTLQFHEKGFEDDDEDCKSHSSILEHLSSLTLESSEKFNNSSLKGSSMNDQVLKVPGQGAQSSFRDLVLDLPINMRDLPQMSMSIKHLDDQSDVNADQTCTTRNPRADVEEPSDSGRDSVHALRNYHRHLPSNMASSSASPIAFGSHSIDSSCSLSSSSSSSSTTRAIASPLVNKRVVQIRKTTLNIDKPRSQELIRPD